MKRLRSILLFIIIFIPIVLSNDVVQYIANDHNKVLTGSFLQEKHNLVGDLELKDHSRTTSFNITSKNFCNHSQSFLSANYKAYNLKIKPATGFLLLKKYLSLIYMFHNFW